MQIQIELTPPPEYDREDTEWQQICQKIYDQLTDDLPELDLQPQEDDILGQAKGDPGLLWFDKLVGFVEPSTAAAGIALKYLFELLFKVQQSRFDQEKARRIKVTIGPETVEIDAEGMTAADVSKVIASARPSE